jgi:hypothetical protein
MMQQPVTPATGSEERGRGPAAGGVEPARWHRAEGWHAEEAASGLVHDGRWWWVAWVGGRRQVAQRLAQGQAAEDGVHGQLHGGGPEGDGRRRHGGWWRRMITLCGASVFRNKALCGTRRERNMTLV